MLGAVDAIKTETAESNRVEREGDREVCERQVLGNLRVERRGIGVFGKMHEGEQKSADQDSYARDRLKDEGIRGKEQSFGTPSRYAGAVLDHVGDHGRDGDLAGN